MSKIWRLLSALAVANFFIAALMFPLVRIIDSEFDFIHSNPIMVRLVPFYPIFCRLTLVIGLYLLVRKVWIATRFKEALFQTMKIWIPTFVITSFFAPAIILYSALYPLASVFIAAMGGLDETTYAPQFSPQKYPLISVGQSDAELKSQVGEPLVVNQMDDGEKVYWYTRPTSGGDFWSVRVVVDASGTVVKKWFHYYFD